MLLYWNSQLKILAVYFVYRAEPLAQELWRDPETPYFRPKMTFVWQSHTLD